MCGAMRARTMAKSRMVNGVMGGCIVQDPRSPGCAGWSSAGNRTGQTTRRCRADHVSGSGAQLVLFPYARRLSAPSNLLEVDPGDDLDRPCGGGFDEVFPRALGIRQRAIDDAAAPDGAPIG